MNAETRARTGKNTLLLKVAVLFVIVAAGGSIFLYYHRDWNAPAAAKNLQNPVPPTEQSIAMGMMNYSIHCQNCHGDKGDGKGSRADSLSIAPSDFTDAHAMGLVTDGALFRASLRRRSVGNWWTSFVLSRKNLTPARRLLEIILRRKQAPHRSAKPQNPASPRFTLILNF